MHSQFPKRVFQASELILRAYKSAEIVTLLKNETKNNYLAVDWTSQRGEISISPAGAHLDKEKDIVIDLNLPETT